MSYRVHFSDRTQVTVEDEQGRKLMEIQASTKKPDYVNIADSQYRLSTIVKVVKVASEPTTVPQLMSGLTKAHDKSIHQQIVNDYKKELTKPNPRKWDEFREAGYIHYYTESDQWCDDRKGTCVCKDKPKLVTTERVSEVMKMMAA